MDLAGTQNYKLSEDARLDLARIYWRGYEEYGEAQADRYYQAFFQRFDEIANSPYQYQLLITLEMVIVEAYVV